MKCQLKIKKPTSYENYINAKPNCQYTEKVQFYPLSIVSNCTTKNKCKITGEDISDQRSGSKFLSAKKIGYKDAHDLRNIDSNERNNLRNRILKIFESKTLFGQQELIKLNEDQKEKLIFWKGIEFDVLRVL